MNPALIISALGPALPLIVRAIESLFPPKTGGTKLDVVAQIVKNVTAALATGGVIPGLPDDAAVKAAVQTVVDRLNGKGVLQGASTQLNVNEDELRTAVEMILDGALRALKVAKAVNA